MKTDATLKEDVMDELDWEPSIDATEIGVTVKNGIVTLSGNVNTYAEKIAAERAAKRVYGVKAVVENVDVKVSGTYKRTDEDIALSVLNNLKWNTSVPEQDIQVKVEDGWVTLEGEVEWNYQKEAAINAIRNLSGVRGVTNLLKVEAAVEPSDIQDKIRKSFERNAEIDADQVNVKIEGHKVILTGTIQSWAEKQQAKNAAWSAPGVTEVEDNLQIKVREHTY